MLLQDQAITRKESVLDDSLGQSCIILCGDLIVLRFTFLKIVKRFSFSSNLLLKYFLNTGHELTLVLNHNYNAFHSQLLSFTLQLNLACTVSVLR